VIVQSEFAQNEKLPYEVSAVGIDVRAVYEFPDPLYESNVLLYARYMVAGADAGTYVAIPMPYEPLPSGLDATAAHDPVIPVVN
jgi:hypothetical protein